MSLKEFLTAKSAFLITILALLLVFSGAQYYLQRQETKLLESELSSYQQNERVIIFLNLFVKKVLNAEGEVSFEDRLELENSIRDIKDQNLLDLWDNFTGAETSDEVQVACKKLLMELVKKITY